MKRSHGAGQKATAQKDIDRILPAKITQPRLGQCYLHERLFLQLDRFRDKPVVWINGPAGSGKTMLVASYLQERKINALWYQIDARDEDPANLFFYLGMAAKPHAPSQRLALPLLTPEYMGGLPAFVHNFFETLFQWLKPPFALVLDNYQSLTEEAVLHEVIRDMLAVVPHGGHVVLISRSQPPPVLGRIQVHQQMALMGWRDLQLSAEEVQALSGLFQKSPMSRTDATALKTATLGWAAGVVLILAQPKPDAASIMADSLSAPQVVFDYFAAEILAKLDKATREFMIKSAFLPQLSADMAAALTHNDQAGQILADLVRKNYFTLQSSNRSLRLYQYHPMFKAFLQHQAHTQLEPEDLEGLKLQAVNILLENHQTEEAVELLVSIQDWQRLTHLIIGLAQAMANQGRIATLQEWINSIPKVFRMNVPWLIYWQGVCKLGIDIEASRSCFEYAFMRFKEGSDPLGFYLSWAGIIETLVYEWGNMTLLDKWIDEIEALLQSHPQFPSPSVQAQVTSAMFCALIYRRPDHPDMGLWEERVKRIILNTNDIHLQFGLGSHLILYYSWWIGGQNKAKFFADTLKQSLSKGDIAPLYQIIWRSINGANLWMTNDFKKSQEVLTQGLAIAEKEGIHFWNFMLLSSLTHCNLCQGKIKDAEAYLNKMAYILDTKRKLDISHLYYMKAFKELCQGNLTLALEHINQSVDLGKGSGAPFAQYYFTTGKADILIELGEFEQADNCIEEAFQYGKKMNSHNIEYQCTWLRAVLNFKQNNDKAGFAHLRHYLSISKTYETVNHSWWRSSVMTPLLQKALEADIEVDHARRLIREHKIEAPVSGYPVKNWPFAIRVYTLGAFAVLLDDKRLSLKRHGQNKPLDLLKAIIAFGGRQVDEKQLWDALWPDADNKAAHVAFSTTLYRLRKLIGYEQAITLRDHRVGLDPRHCWVDVWPLQHLLSQTKAMELATEQDAIDGSEIAEKIFRLYQGAFLPGDEAPWVLGTREHLGAKVLQNIDAIAARYRVRKQWDLAITIYEQGLALDPLVEPFYQGLMQCYLRMDRRADALAIYQRCRKILEKVEKAAPSADIETLHNQLLDGNNAKTEA